MTPELAKQLKDAGFPQGISRHIDDANIELFAGVRMPSLSELIEACGDGFQALLNRHDGMWDAVPNANIGTPTASTPEEAVAKLWLALNQ